MKTIHKIRHIVSVDDIIADELYTKLFGPVPMDKFYHEGVKKTSHVELPLVEETLDGKYTALTHIGDIEAAKAVGIKTIEVDVVTNLEPEDKLPFILFTDFYHGRDHIVMSLVIDAIMEYSKTAAGKIWYNGLPGDKEEKLAFVLGVKKGVVKGIISVSINHREELDMVQSGEIGWEGLRKMINTKEKDAAKATASAVGQKKEVEINPLDTLEVTDEEEADEKHGDTTDDEEEDYYEDGSDDGEEEGADGNTMTVGTTTATSISNYEPVAFTLKLKDDRIIDYADQTLTVNGVKVDTAYKVVVDDGTKGCTPYCSITFSTGSKKDNSFQIVFDNPRKFFL